MNKQELIATVSENLGISQKTVTLVLNGITETIGETVANGEEVLLVDFGKFKSTLKKGRNCRNPKTGESIYIEDAIIPVFKAGKRLKQTVNTIGEKDESI
ncbi:HU family DNA-binding protein [Microcoleus sp. herbarium14]|uniref:HU family DNA-binding protein n=1 Tax=Microcoleus sp. herbarium14 TaxID=3055439 RepID=UPI002FD63537